MYSKLRYKLKSMWLVLIARSYYIISDKGAEFELPERRDVLEALQDELEGMDRYLEDMITDLILEERDLDE